MVMSRRQSGYARKANDLYQTPAWVTEALCRSIALPPVLLEPACGDGQMERTLVAMGHTVIASDIEPGLDSSGAAHDFLALDYPVIDEHREIGGIVTNPPFSLADEFVMHAINRMKRGAGMVAMLLPSDWDHAACRRHLLGECPQFAKKVVLTRRIRWFEGTDDDKGKQPMNNHAWYVWDWRHHGPAQIIYAICPPAPRAKRVKKEKVVKLVTSLDATVPDVGMAA